MAEIDDILSIKDVLKLMDSGKIFSVSAVTWDTRRMENSGDIKQYDEAILLVHLDKLEGYGERPLTKVERLQSITGQVRKPNTEIHFIRDIQPLTGGIPMGHPVRIHPRLILFFNNKKVMP